MRKPHGTLCADVREELRAINVLAITALVTRCIRMDREHCASILFPASAAASALLSDLSASLEPAKKAEVAA
jgi:hypothetical protein